MKSDYWCNGCGSLRFGESWDRNKSYGWIWQGKERRPTAAFDANLTTVLPGLCSGYELLTHPGSGACVSTASQAWDQLSRSNSLPLIQHRPGDPNNML